MEEIFVKCRDEVEIWWGAKWELFKQDIKMKTIERAVCIKRTENEEEDTLRRNLSRMLKLECQMPGLFGDDIATIKSRLEAIDQERYRGATIRARAERLLAGEAPTKRALEDEMRYVKANKIEQITCKGVVMREEEQIKREFVRFYTELFIPACPKVDVFEREFLSLLPELYEDTR